MATLEALKIKFEDMNKSEREALEGIQLFHANTFDFCLSVFQSVENKDATMAEISRELDQSRKSISIFYATGSVFAEFDGYAEFSELSPLTPSQVKELAQDRRLGIQGLKDLVIESADLEELVKNLETHYKKPAKKTESKKEEGKKQNRARKENDSNPIQSVDDALAFLNLWFREIDDVQKVKEVRAKLIGIIQTRNAEGQKVA